MLVKVIVLLNTPQQERLWALEVPWTDMDASGDLQCSFYATSAHIGGCWDSQERGDRQGNKGCGPVLR
jgi:hypothetical protein